MNPSREQPAPMRPVLTVGRYSLFGELATGGMATVHFGRMHAAGGFSKTVAIKRMRRDIGMDKEFVAMFLDEARLTSRIEHPNVVATIDVVADGQEVFLVLEYVRGESLERLRRAARARREHIPVPIALSVMCGVLAGLHAAHNALGEDGRPLEIVHRDVSPQNILVGEDGVARISDFGIAKAESRLQVTHDGQMKGKLPYMAPEQLAGNVRLDRRVDVFSATTVLWELLAGRTLFRADHPGETIAKVLSAPIPSLCSIRPDVPPALDLAIRRGLSRPPDQRPATAEEHAELLENAFGGGLASARAVGAWVASLAADDLASRHRYVREMESISHLDATIPRQPSAPQLAAPPDPAQGSMPSLGAFPSDASPSPKVDESSLPSGSLQSFGSPTSPAPADDFEASLRSSRTVRFGLVLGGSAFLATCAILVLIVALMGHSAGTQLPAAAALPTASAPVAESPADASPADSVRPEADAEAPEPSASASGAPDTTPPKAAFPAATRPPPRAAPTRPYLPDMP